MPKIIPPVGQAISLVNIIAPNLSTHPHYEKAYVRGLTAEFGPGDTSKAMLDYYVFDDELNTHQHISQHAKGLLSTLNNNNRKELEQWIKALL
ncbi:MAG: hypothetical protein ACJAVV_001309 [Alphaproteobacteria bacterium]